MVGVEVNLGADNLPASFIGCRSAPGLAYRAVIEFPARVSERLRQCSGVVTNTGNSGCKQASGNKSTVWDEAGRCGLKGQLTAGTTETPVGEALLM